MYTYIHLYIHIHICTHMYTYAYINIYTHIHTHIYTNIFTHTHVSLSIYINTHTYTHIYKYNNYCNSFEYICVTCGIKFSWNMILHYYYIHYFKVLIIRVRLSVFNSKLFFPLGSFLIKLCRPSQKKTVKKREMNYYLHTVTEINL